MMILLLTVSSQKKLFHCYLIISSRCRATFCSVLVWAETGDFRDAHSGMSGNMDHPQLPFPASARSRTRERKGKEIYLKLN